MHGCQIYYFRTTILFYIFTNRSDIMQNIGSFQKIYFWGKLIAMHLRRQKFCATDRVPFLASKFSLKFQIYTGNFERKICTLCDRYMALTEYNIENAKFCVVLSFLIKIITIAFQI